MPISILSLTLNSSLQQNKETYPPESFFCFVCYTENKNMCDTNVFGCHPKHH